MLLAALTLAALAGRPPAAFLPPPILMYHRVDVDRPCDSVGRSLTISPAQFEAELQYLRSRRIAVISMEQLYRRMERGAPLDRVVVATFDDGYDDQYRYAVPLLRRYGDGATFYVVTGNIGRPRHLTWTQLRDMRADGMDLAAHGVAHDDLSKMTPLQQAYQIDGSVDTLRQELGEPVDSYAYPSGRFNRETLALVRRAGVSLAVTTDPQYVIRPQNGLELVRIRVRSTWTAKDFEQAVAAARGRSAVVLDR